MKITDIRKPEEGSVKKILANLPVDPASLARIEAGGVYAVDVIEDHAEAAGRILPEERLADAAILLCDYPPGNFDAMRSLEFIQLSSVGFERLHGLGLVEKGIRACNARGVFDVPIAEWNIGMMINLARDLRGMIRNQEKGAWDRDARFHAELRGSVVGLWGYGGIGRETARLGKAMGLTIHAFTRTGKGTARSPDYYGVPGTGDPGGVLPDRFFGPAEKDAFLAGLDFLILAMPRNRETEGIVGEAELRALPARAFVLNPARGPLIREDALVRALEEGWIAGAALDTHYHYPMPPEHPLWKFPNVIMTPHISGSSGGRHYLPRVWDIFEQNLERLAAGKGLLNELTAEELRM